MRAYFFRADNNREQKSLTIEERQEYEFEVSVFSRINPKEMQTVTLTKEQAVKLWIDLRQRLGNG